MRLLSALFCPATAAVCLGKTFWDSKETAWIRRRHTGRSTAPCAHETACACVQEHSTLPRRLSLPGLIVMTFQRLISRRRLQSLQPSETFQRLVRHETSICRVLQIPNRPRCHGVTLVRKLRFTALYWPSNCVSLQKRRPKLLKKNNPTTQKLLYLKNSFLFDSRTLRQDPPPWGYFSHLWL